MLKNIGINHIVVETDSPYLPPEEKRGEENSPMNLKYIIGKIAKELDISEDEIIKIRINGDIIAIHPSNEYEIPVGVIL